jgi:hypothetical protein
MRIARINCTAKAPEIGQLDSLDLCKGRRSSFTKPVA